MDRRKLLAVVLVALALRLVRAGLRWDEICLAYAAYQQPWPEQGLMTFFGLHPPGYSLVFWLLPSSPAAWLGFSALCGVAAVWLVGRIGGWAAAAFLAVDPLQLAYAAEVNNYPLLVLCIAAALHEHHHKRWWGLALVGVAAGWTHLLGGFAVGLVALTGFRRPRETAATLAVMALGCLPVVVVASGLAGGEGTYGQGGLDVAALVQGLWDKAGWWLLTWPLALALAPRRAGLVLAMGAAVLGVMLLGIAASHQQPYWLVLGPPMALMFSHTSGARGWLSKGVPVLGLLLVVPAEFNAVKELRRNLDRERAIDVALVVSSPGDALWLLKPALKVDDDKTAWSDVFWRFSPWSPMPEWTGDFEYVDYRYGQPRLIEGRVVHGSTDLAPEVVPEVVRAHLDAGRGVWFVLYDHGPANDYPGRMAGVLQGFETDCEWVGEDVGLGIDQLCEVR